jgi:hypothetical protein
LKLLFPFVPSKHPINQSTHQSAIKRLLAPKLAPLLGKQSFSSFLLSIHDEEELLELMVVFSLIRV